MAVRNTPEDDNTPVSTVKQPGNGPGFTTPAKKAAVNKFRKASLMAKVKKNKMPKLRPMNE